MIQTTRTYLGAGVENPILDWIDAFKAREILYIYCQRHLSLSLSNLIVLLLLLFLNNQKCCPSYHKQPEDKECGRERQEWVWVSDGIIEVLNSGFLSLSTLCEAVNSHILQACEKSCFCFLHPHTSELLQLFWLLHEDWIGRKQKGIPNLGHCHCELSKAGGRLVLKDFRGDEKR